MPPIPHDSLEAVGVSSYLLLWETLPGRQHPDLLRLPPSIFIVKGKGEVARVWGTLKKSPVYLRVFAGRGMGEGFFFSSPEFSSINIFHLNCSRHHVLIRTRMTVWGEQLNPLELLEFRVHAHMGKTSSHLFLQILCTYHGKYSWYVWKELILMAPVDTSDCSQRDLKCSFKDNTHWIGSVGDHTLSCTDLNESVNLIPV